MNWTDIPSLTALRAFEAAARCRSFSAAARELNVTHAAIAQNVRTLEAHFGLSLMVRDGRGMTPTADGADLAHGLSDAFSQIGSTTRDLLDRSKTRALRVSVTPSFAANWLMPRIGSFWNAHPDIELELIPSMSLVDLRRDNIDVAIRYGKGGWPETQSPPLMPAGHVAVAAPSLVEGRSVRCLSDLKGETWLMDGMRSEERLWIRANGIDLEQEKVTILSTGQLTREAAKAGLGVTILPAPIAASEIAAGRLVRLCEEEASVLAYHILIRDEVVLPTRDIFVKWLRSEVAD